MTTTEAGIETTLDELIALGRSQSVSVHGVSDGDLYELMERGVLNEIKREQPHHGLGAYLVGKTEINGVNVTLFGKHAVEDPS
jgi:hypothetical protein